MIFPYNFDMWYMSWTTKPYALHQKFKYGVGYTLIPKYSQNPIFGFLSPKTQIFIYYASNNSFSSPKYAHFMFEIFYVGFSCFVFASALGFSSKLFPNPPRPSFFTFLLFPLLGYWLILTISMSTVEASATYTYITQHIHCIQHNKLIKTWNIKHYKRTSTRSSYMYLFLCDILLYLFILCMCMLVCVNDTCMYLYEGRFSKCRLRGVFVFIKKSTYVLLFTICRPRVDVVTHKLFVIRRYLIKKR